MIDILADVVATPPAQPIPARYVEFWGFDKVKSEEVLVVLEDKLMEHLRLNEYYKVLLGREYVFVRQDNNIIAELQPQQILDEVMGTVPGILLHYLALSKNAEILASTLPEHMDHIPELTDEVRRIFYSRRQLRMLTIANIEKAFLKKRKALDTVYFRYLPEKTPEIVRDTRATATLLYANTMVVVTADRVRAVPYSEAAGVVWKAALLERPYVQSDGVRSQFEEFIRLLCSDIGPGVGKDRPVSLDEARYRALRTSLGYMLHTYKNSGETKSVILTEVISGMKAEGGTGKSLCVRALGKFRPTVNIDGKQKIFQDAHAWSAVDRNTKIVHIEDAERRFPYEQLFNYVTGDWTINEKYGARFTLAFQDSPKLILTTNYAVGGFTSSFRRRMHEVEISRYFSAEYQPADHFGGLFFEDWTDAEWARFDDFMIGCIQEYLREGLTDYQKINIGERRLEVMLPDGFLEFAKSELHLYKKYISADVLEQFQEMEGAKILTPHKLVRGMRDYGESQGWELLSKIERNPEPGAKPALRRVYMFVEKDSGIRDISVVTQDGQIQSATPDFGKPGGDTGDPF